MVDFSINVADAAIGLRRASKTKRCGQKNTCVFDCCRARKKRYILRVFFFKYSYVRVLLIDGGAAKKALGRSTRKKSNNLELHFPTSATKSRSLEDTQNAVVLPHTAVRAPETRSQGGGLFD